MGGMKVSLALVCEKSVTVSTADNFPSIYNHDLLNKEKNKERFKILFVSAFSRYSFK